MNDAEAERDSARMQSRINAARAEAVLAFADALDAERPGASMHRFRHRAAQFLLAQGWSLPAAERTEGRQS